MDICRWQRFQRRLFRPRQFREHARNELYIDDTAMATPESLSHRVVHLIEQRPKIETLRWAKAVRVVVVEEVASLRMHGIVVEVRSPVLQAL